MIPVTVSVPINNDSTQRKMVMGRLDRPDLLKYARRNNTELPQLTQLGMCNIFTPT